MLHITSGNTECEVSLIVECCRESARTGHGGPRRRNVTTSMVGLKNGRIHIISSKMMKPRGISGNAEEEECHGGIFFFVCLFVCVFLLSSFISVCLSVFVSFFLYFFLSVCLSLFLSFFISFCLSVCLCFFLPLFLSVCLYFFCVENTMFKRAL